MRLALKASQIYLFIPIIIILFPTFPGILPELLGFQLLFAFEIVIWLYLLLKKYYKIIPTFEPILIMTYFIAACCLSLTIDLMRGVVVISDFFELLKPISFLLFFFFYRFSIVENNILIDNTLKVILFTSLFLAIFSLCSFCFPAIFRPIEFFLYKRTSVAILANKAIGSFSTTYHFAYFLLLPLIYYTVRLLKSPSIIIIFSFSLILLALLLTQSRSMYICAIFSMTMCFFLPILHSTRKRSSLTILIISTLIIILSCTYLTFENEINEIFSYASEGFNTMMEGNNNSVNVRENQIQWAIANNKIILVGWGIGKGEIMLESFYSLYYYRYGLIGIAIVLFILFIMGKRSLAIAKYFQPNDDKKSIFFYSLSVFYFVTPLALTSSCHMDSPKISILYYGLMGLICRTYYLTTKRCFDA